MQNGFSRIAVAIGAGVIMTSTLAFAQEIPPAPYLSAPVATVPEPMTYPAAALPAEEAVSVVAPLPQARPKNLAQARRGTSVRVAQQENPAIVERPAAAARDSFWMSIGKRLLTNRASDTRCRTIDRVPHSKTPFHAQYG